MLLLNSSCYLSFWIVAFDKVVSIKYGVVLVVDKYVYVFFFFCIFYGGEGICIDTILEWNRIGFGHTKNITYKKYIYIWNIILREKVCSISFLFYFYFLSLCWLLGVQMSLSFLLGLVVATDDDKIAECCRGFGAHVIMTSESCRNGSQLGFEFLANFKL